MARQCKILAAQSRDFNEFRHQLAGSAPTASGSLGRAATGKVQTQVGDQRAPTAPDKLTLSKRRRPRQEIHRRTARPAQAGHPPLPAEELSKNFISG